MIEKLKNAKYIVAIGIGGSDLAAKAVWQALTLHRSDIQKKIYFLESPDSREYEEFDYIVREKMISPEDFALVVTSKSGETKETLDTFDKIFEMLTQKFGRPVSDRMLAITSPSGALFKVAESKNISILPWEGDIGGRWSAFTVAHTTVLSLGGLDADAFLAGGDEMKKRNEEGGASKAAASNVFDAYQNGADILDFFFFNAELEDLGKWCRQLIAESLGKENKNGEKIGITPTVSIGPVDLHSMLQLNLGGPKNRFTFFVRSLKEIEGSINESAYENTINAYAEAELPYEKYEMTEINERELGKFMAYLMAVTVELATLLLVDPYNQPAVEEYKKHLTNN